MAAARAVLLSPDFIAAVTSYQGGVYQDLRYFRTKLCPIYAAFFVPAPIQRHMATAHTILAPWLREHEFQRIPKAVQFSKKLKQLFVQYAVFHGNVAMATYLHHAYDLCSINDPLVDLAALNGQLDMVYFLRRIRHDGQTANALAWAKTCGHTTVAQYLELTAQASPTTAPGDATAPSKARTSDGPKKGRGN